ncbi:hypothetical protein J2Y58_002971 [Sphingomonas sp. BE138]|uniref:DUF6975 family protein n=1 Tax=Sphingomonas sp. BE138 TaxID=2817845 RepID=UPI0028554960|nr:hypothetical protein [Sphingomonas sp. BE138]MDR6789598.1 hypothetical protein [Sphingomonas sp. BE138]
MTIALDKRPGGCVDTILAMVAADGTAASPHARALTQPSATLRDIADAVHALCVIHGAFPGIVDQAGASGIDPAARDWLDRAAAAMSAERALLVRLTAAAGPLPSTPGQAASQAAILAQRNALEMLARSDRLGCATGTAIAFVLDWAAVRGVLDSCARRMALPTGDDFTQPAAAALALLRATRASAPVERAMAFGAQQMLAQHRGLWQLLKARATARSDL